MGPFFVRGDTWPMLPLTRAPAATWRGAATAARVAPRRAVKRGKQTPEKGREMDKNSGLHGGTDTDPQEPQGQEPQGQEPQGGQPQGGDPQGADGDGAGQQPAGNGGQGSTVNRHKYERDTARLQAENDALRAQLDETAKLRKDFEDYRAEREAERVAASLKAAGCIDVKAAGACLEDYKGDVAELKKAKPYLFASEDNGKSTSGTKKGKADDADEELDRYFGL